MQNYSGEEGLQYHLQIRKGDVGRYVILPGDPKRCVKIAQYFDNPVLIADNREYITYTGTLDGVKVSVTSTGIGGPSASIAMEELYRCGADTFVRIGTCGGMQTEIKSGDIVIATAAVRMEGTSREYAPIEYPAVANFECTTALFNAAKEKGIEPFVGITASSDTFYPGQERYDTYSGKVYRDYQGLLKQWQDLNVMNYEMESATLFTMCNALGLRAGMVAGVIVNRTQQEIPNEATMKDTEDKAVSVVVEAARKLLA